MRIGSICWVVAAFAALTAGCGDKSTGDGNADAAAQDAQAVDGALTDAGASDAEAPDAEVSDAAPSDAAVVDAETPDTAVDAGPQCGDGVLDPGELCDTAIGSGPGSCPTSCTSTDPCQPIVLQNGGTCAAECVTTTITGCVGGDSCCPSGCDAVSDADCAAVCGNGVLEPGELCDTAIGSGPGTCPTNCDDSDGCTIDTMVGTGCQAECDHTPIPPLPSGTGYDVTALQWNVPDVSAWGSNFFWVHKQNESAYWNWTVLDMNGDHMPDLVWSEDPDQYYDAWNQACEPYWKVFLNTGASFAATETIWPVPDVSTWGSNFFWVHKQNESAYWNWTVLDMDGDGQPDLVWSEDPDQYYDAWINAAQPFWKVFLAQ